MDFNILFKCACGHASHPCYLSAKLNYVLNSLGKKINDTLLNFISEDVARVDSLQYHYKIFPLKQFIRP